MPQPIGSNSNAEAVNEAEKKVYDFTVTVGVKAVSEEIAKFVLQEHMRYMTLVHGDRFVDTKLDCVFERRPISVPSSDPRD